MKKERLSSTTQIIAAGLLLLFIGFLSCNKPVSPVITGWFGRNDTFSRIGEADAGNAILYSLSHPEKSESLLLILPKSHFRNDLIKFD